jgi:hypothetical protein
MAAHLELLWVAMMNKIAVSTRQLPATFLKMTTICEPWE